MCRPYTDPDECIDENSDEILSSESDDEDDSNEFCESKSCDLGKHEETIATFDNSHEVSVLENSVVDNLYDDGCIEIEKAKEQFESCDKFCENQTKADNESSKVSGKCNNESWGSESFEQKGSSIGTLVESEKKKDIYDDENDDDTNQTHNSEDENSSDIEDICNFIDMVPEMTLQAYDSTAPPLLFFECAHYFYARDQYIRLVMVRPDNKHVNWCREKLFEMDLKQNPFLKWDGNKAYTTRNDMSHKEMYVEILVIGNIILDQLNHELTWGKVGKTQRASRDPTVGVYRRFRRK